MQYHFILWLGYDEACDVEERRGKAYRKNIYILGGKKK
jgi:hypothetical protein